MEILNYKFQLTKLNRILKSLIYFSFGVKFNYRNDKFLMVVLPAWAESPLNYSRFCKVTNHHALQIVCNA
jgi:hypothetical protein